MLTVPVLAKSNVPFCSFSQPLAAGVVLIVPGVLKITVSPCDVPLFTVTVYSVVVGVPEPPNVTVLLPAKSKCHRSCVIEIHCAVVDNPTCYGECVSTTCSRESTAV